MEPIAPPKVVERIKATNDINATYAVLEKIRKVWYEGRPIVPIIGAGFSADTGYPILNSICRYLARFKYALDKDLLLPHFKDDVAPALQDELRRLIKRAQDEPIRYIARFGWPDRFDLTQRVARHVCEAPGDRVGTHHQLIENEINDRHDWLAEKSTSQRAADHWQKEIIGRKQLRGEGLAWDRWAVQGDWRRLIQFFTDYQGDYADALFARFGFLRDPGPGHRYMTLLAKLLSLRTIFTFNFDDLIEKAFSHEGLAYRVYGMERGRTLPSPRVVGEGLAVIKMHGSHHSILIDQTLDRPLNPAYIRRFYDLAGPDCLLLVLGCSGDDRRLKDLLTNRHCAQSGRDAEVCWVHFEKNSPVAEWPRTEQEKDAPPILHCPTNHPAAFVRHLLYFLSGRFPSSAHPYPSHPGTPICFGKPSRTDADDLRKTPTSADPYYLDPKRRNPATSDYSFQSNLEVKTSEELLALGQACVNNGFIPIWVDLEVAHTLAGLVGAILDGCRRVDTELPPAVMPFEDLGQQSPKEALAQQSQEEALARLEHALQRQRYAVLVDGVNTYGSSLLMHHSSQDGTDAEKQAKLCKDFLTDLRAGSLGQSIIIASTSSHEMRRFNLFPPEGSLLRKDIPGVSSDFPFVWACLATLRRTRALPSLRRLLAPLVPCDGGDESGVDRFLCEQASQPDSHVYLLEGGELWFNGTTRDKIYTAASAYTSKTVFEELQETKPEQRPQALGQSLLMGLLHQKIASTYFSFEFMQSRDAASFLEYTYHCLSGIRYYSRAIFLLANYASAWDTAKALLLATVQGSDQGKARESGQEAFDPAKYFGQLWDDLIKKTPRDLVTSLRLKRAYELEAFLASWKQFEQEVRVQIPAEQLLQWIKEILHSDNLNRLSGVYVGTQWKRDADDESEKKCGELHLYFTRLQARIHLERGDFEAAFKILEDNSGDASNQIGNLLDQVECKARGGAIQEARDLLGKLNQPELAEEKAYRHYHMNGLVNLGGRSWIDEGLNDEGRLPVKSIRTKEAKEAEAFAEKGLEEIRRPGELLADPLEGMIVSSGSPGSVYHSYRSVFRTLKGRAIIGAMLRSPLKSQADGADNKKSLERDLAAFRRAMRQFDQAKAGLKTQQAVLRGWADLHAAESSLLFVRRTFERGDESALGLIESKLLSCRTQLRSGMEALRVGRRNTLWWKHCVQLIAQYHTERLLVDCCRLSKLLAAEKVRVERLVHSRLDPTLLKHLLAPDQERVERLVKCGLDLMRRYNRALEAVAIFADYTLQRDKAFENPWLQRILAEVHLGSALAVAMYECTVEARRFPVGQGGSPGAGSTVTSTPTKASLAGRVLKIVDALLDYSKTNHPRAFGSGTADGAPLRAKVSAAAARLKTAVEQKRGEALPALAWRGLIVQAARGTS